MHSNAQTGETVSALCSFSGFRGSSCCRMTFGPRLTHSDVDKQVIQPADDANAQQQFNFISISGRPHEGRMKGKMRS